MSAGAAAEAAPAEGGAAACGARLREGGRCLRPPAAGKRRCRRHGGVATAEAMAQRRAVSAFIRACYRTIREFERG